MSKIDSNDVAIKVSNLHKIFKVPLDGGMNLKQRIVNIFQRKKGYREFSPLNGISFEIKKGEFFGIVGRNGSGKSTLLKTIAGIYTPEKGSVKVNGVLVPFIELGVGFNPELTGKENVYLNGAMLGFSRSEIADLYDDIVDFAELHEFMDERLKNYSSGMQVRLAFSIAIRAQGDILLLDEVLAVGDSAFQQKCYSYFHNLKLEGRTVILVTHSMSAVERFCTRALILDKGKIKMIGDKTEVANMYEELFVEEKNRRTQASKNDGSVSDASVVAKLVPKEDAGQRVRYRDSITLNVEIQANVPVSAGNLGINIRNENQEIVFSTDTRQTIGNFEMKKNAKKSITISIDNLYTNGVYTVGMHVVDENRRENAILYMNRAIEQFTSYGVVTHAHSLFHPNYQIEEG